MIAMLGLGLQEIILLGVLGGGAAVVALVLFLANRGGSGGSSRVQELERENERLRDRLDDNRRRPE